MLEFRHHKDKNQRNQNQNGVLQLVLTFNLHISKWISLYVNTFQNEESSVSKELNIVWEVTDLLEIFLYLCMLVYVDEFDKHEHCLAGLTQY